MKRSDLSISEKLDYNWMCDMYDVGHSMLVSETGNSLGEHIIHYGMDCVKFVNHNTWLAFQSFKQHVHA